MSKKAKISPDTVKVNALAKSVMESLQDYAKITREAVQRAVTTAAEATAEELKTTSPKRSGDYAKSWATKEDKNSAGSEWYKRIVYAKSPHYRLTHLLEHGHRKYYFGRYIGGRTRERPHIAPAEERAAERLTAELKKEIENA